jgi:hypothetical protein
MKTHQGRKLIDITSAVDVQEFANEDGAIAEKPKVAIHESQFNTPLHA